MDDRQLSNEEKEAVWAWIEERVGALECSVCSSQDWILGDIKARFISGVTKASGYPAVVLVCRHCAYMLAFNAILVGVEEPDPPNAEEASDE